MKQNVDISPLHESNMPAMLSLYCSAFPDAERRSTDALRQLLSTKANFKALQIDFCNSFSGFLTFWDFGGARYIEHFAINPDLRSHGIGSIALNYFLSLSETPVVIEVEPDTDMLTHRRIKFYKRHGFALRNEISYIQPPYEPGLPEIKLNLMTHGALTTPELAEVVATIKREVYGQATNK